MNREKGMLKSRGVMGGVTAIAGVLVPIVARKLGYDLTADDVGWFVTQGTILGGAAVAIWGRVKATKRIR